MGSSLHIFMHLFFLLSFRHVFAATNSSSATQPLCHSDESFALLQFKHSLVINKFASNYPSAYQKVKSWTIGGESGDCCSSWDGVECDKETGHVIGLDLSSSFLFGSINSNSTLFNLVHLQRLNLADNHFNYSQVPSAIGHLLRLTSLNLSQAFFYGQIPSEISQLSKLTSLCLSYNRYFPDPNHYQKLLQIEKPILINLVQNLTKLEVLDLNYVTMPYVLPDKLANMSTLKALGLRDCELQGEFPRGIFLLPNLRVLQAHYNQQLSGHIPEFDTRSPLKTLILDLSSFSGELPNSIGNLDSLNVLSISGCNFSGSIPSSFGNLTQLLYVNLFNNSFMNQVPSSFGNLTQLAYLDLSNNHFTGQIPSSFTNLGQITKLSFFNNNFSGDNLSLLGKLTKLQSLNLGGNNLNCEIPSSFANLTQLHILGFSSNQLPGRIPSWLTNMTQLTALGLSENLLQGPIPESISQLVNMEVLDLASNNLSGTMKVFLTLTKLYWLQLSHNRLTLDSSTSFVNATTLPKFKHLELASCGLTEFPEFLRDQHELRWLSLSNNKIEGLVPKWIWNMSKETLFAMGLSHNFLTGFDQPPLLLPWSSLRLLDLASNKLQGSLPIPPLSTYAYSVSNNQLTGEIPPWLCNVSSLYALDLSYNHLSGSIPQCVGSFSDSLSLLNLQSNNLSGPIPQIYKNGSKLMMIDLSRNQLLGPVPRSMVNCSLLEILNLGDNQINDTFPFWLGNLSELKVLILRFNRFHGAIQNPESSFAFPKLKVIDLNHNRFTGKLPSDYFQTWRAMRYVDINQSTYMGTSTVLMVPDYTWNDDYYYSMTLMNKGVQLVYEHILGIFTAIDLSSNKLEGDISESIGILRGLRTVNFSNNNLIGHIPSSFVNLTVLESLDLSQNNLSGEIPQQLTQLTFLEFFNVSHNHLTGHIPRGNQFDTFEKSSFDENEGLCGDPLSKKCGNSEATPPPPNIEEDEDSKFPSKFDWLIICMGYGSGLIVGFVIGQTVTTRKHEWFVTTFGRRQQKQSRQKRKGRRN
ncbi:receptor-like protein 7 [Cornus florida]|uniref:receptor-like protein 7 n=1 Tax=Cornus florida TaxID=4283 RepID=UPI0028A128FF|nr:receptor-like protein 7 [Cornus florida]